ncbi:MAG: zinc ABC transporter substrate-binding protein [Desulfotomaculaceae bacterium]|nr:zinc ABC transporter substrate-binding protein [Desulfotomaculaceae bacterium]
MILTTKEFYLLLFLLLALVCTFAGCDNNKVVHEQAPSDKPVIAVSIVPQATFVKEVAGDLVNVVTMIPPGMSPANYAPTPQEMGQFSRASLYFTIGVPTETANILPEAAGLNPDIRIISLNNEVAKVFPEREIAPGMRDPHIWLSPKRVKVMVNSIARELSAIDPPNKEVYENNAAAYIKKIDKLDQDIFNSLKNLSEKAFIVYHPAFGYFADDYGLQMVSLEEEGKEATAKSLKKAINFAKEENIKVIFYQEEIDSKQSHAFAEEIGGKAEMIAPLAPNYIYNLEKTARVFAEVLS